MAALVARIRTAQTALNVSGAKNTNLLGQTGFCAQSRDSWSCGEAIHSLVVRNRYSEKKYRRWYFLRTTRVPKCLSQFP